MSLPIDVDAQDGDVDWDELLQGQNQGGVGAAPEETPACQTCRKKKSRCSRQQPCSQCVKSGVDCVYEDKRSKGGIKVGVIERLNQRIDTLENMFLGQSILMRQLMQAKDPSTEASHLDTSASNDLATCTDSLRRSLLSAAESARDTGRESVVEAADITPTKKRKREEEQVPARQDQIQRTASADTNARDTLPLMAPVEAILETYFKLIHPWIPVLHPSIFLQRAREPNRPAGVSLIIQAITVVASPYTPETVSTADPVELERYISRLRQDVIASAIESSAKEAIQGLILVAFDSLKRGFSRSPWSLVAIICRKIDGLQLNAEERIEKSNLASFFSQPPPPLDPPTAWIEVEECRRVFWGAFLLDRFCSIVTGLTPSISSKSIQRRLPCDGYMWELDQRVETSFFKIHEENKNDAEDSGEADESPFPLAYANAEGPSGIGGLAYSIEATESLFLVTKFHERHTLELDSSSQLSSWLHKFRRLDSRLLQWELCLTHRWREVRVVDGYIDPNLTIAHMTHNAAIITLHSLLAHPPQQARAWLSMLVSGASKEACVMAAIKIDRIARRFLDASTGIPPHQFALCLYIAGQVLLRWNTAGPLETASSLITSLQKVSQRLVNGRVDGPNKSDIAEDPAMRLMKELVAQRDTDQVSRVKPATLAAASGNGTDACHGQPLMNMVDFSAMLQNFARSPSSGGSVFGFNFLDQDSPRDSDQSRPAIRQSLLPSGKLPAARLQEEGTVNPAEEEPEFDFMAELRKLEARARDHDRRLRGQGGDSQPKQ